MADLFTSALSGMNAAQLGVVTAEHNIANASTPGYTRQQVLLGARAGQQTGGGFVGQGVDVTGVVRIYDQYLNIQVLQEQNQASYLTAYHSAMTQIDNLIADPAAGASPAMQSFFEALNGVANNPESMPARQTLLGNAQFAVNRFQAIDQRLTDIADGLTGQISSSVNMVNSYAQQIATLNGSIKRATASGQGQQPNDLIDQRDQLINQLNQEIKTNVLRQPDGTASVFIGSGQALVIDEQTMRLQVVQSANDPSKVDIAYLNNGRAIAMQQSSLQGGKIGAYLTFRDQSLEPARNALGRVALGMAISVNQQNQLGQDLNGALGGNLFNVASPRVDKNANNNSASGVPSVAITDVAGLTGNDYQLRFNGGTSYTLLRLPNNVATNLDLATPQTVDGMTITAPVPVTAGDSFLIRPTANAARDIALATSDPTKIAAAVPIRATSALTNSGTATISAGTVASPLNANVQLPVTLTFNNPPTTYSLTSSNASIAADGTTVTVANTTNMAVGMPLTGYGFPTGTTIASITNGTTFVASAATVSAVPATGQTLQIGSYSYTSGSDISFNGWTTKISGSPVAGDVFNVSTNTNATGDNRNALLMAGLQTQNLMANGTVSLQGAYGQLVGDIGAKTGELAVTSLAQTSMVAQTVAAQQAVSGVNLDEEAANLIRFQKAYQAAAKAMQIAQTMFDAIMNIG